MTTGMKEIEINAEFKKENGTCFYQCPTATWRFKGEERWRNTTSTWETCSDLLSGLDTALFGDEAS